MNSNVTQKILRHSLTRDEIIKWNYQIIYTSWNKNIVLKNNENLPDILPIEASQQNIAEKNLTKFLSKQTFANNSQSNMQNSPIKNIKKIKLSKKIISSTKVLLFNNKESLLLFLKQQKNLQKISFWFIEFKQFFLQLPQNNINLWYFNQSSILNAINILMFNKINFFYLNIKSKKIC